MNVASRVMHTKVTDLSASIRQQQLFTLMAQGNELLARLYLTVSGGEK